MTITTVWITHTFEVHIPSVTWRDIPGIYIFCAVTPQNMWKPIYIGQADSLKARLANHERWEEAVALGATHVHAMAASSAQSRDAIERQLIRAYGPRLNTHHVG
jgi:excinuclease UvrABC nuclease subunit